MDDLMTLCLLGIFVVVGLLLLPRLLGGLGGGGMRGGQEYPRYDDPDIRSGGRFGGFGPRVNRRYDDPNIRSRGSFGRGFGGVFRPRSTRRTDSPNIRSRGGFGRSKD